MTAEVKYPESGKLMREAMSKACVSNSVLANKLNVTFATISRLANGNTKPRPKLAYELNKFFDSTVFEQASRYDPETGVTINKFSGTIPKVKRIIAAPVDTFKSVDADLTAAKVELAKLMLRIDYLTKLKALLDTPNV